MKTKILFLPILILLTFILTNPKIAIAKNQLNLATNAQSAILMEKSTSRVLFEKNPNQKLPMASCTKILTAITVIENTQLDNIVTIDKNSTNIEGSSLYLKEGDKYTVLDLLYGLMLRSGNDCAIALAIHTSKTVNDFLRLMNNKAKEIGATNSNFETPHGLDSEKHHTTAYDLGLISCYALKNNTFSDIVSSKYAEIENKSNGETKVIYNKNKLLTALECSDGVKTGYTKKSGRCFVGSATKNNMQLIAVVLNCAPMFEETKEMLEYGFANFSLKRIVEKNKIFYSQKNKNEIFISQQQFDYPLKKDGSEDGIISISIDETSIKNPQLKITFVNKLLFCEKLSIIKR